MKRLWLFGLVALLLTSCQSVDINQPSETMEAPVTKTEEAIKLVEPIPYEVYGSTPLVRQIAQAMYEHKTSIDITGMNESLDTIIYSATEASAQNPMLLNHPDHFIPVEGKTLEISYQADETESKRRREAVWSIVSDLVRHSNYQSLSDFDKSLLAYELVIDQVEYDHMSNNAINSGDYSTNTFRVHSQDAYGALVERSAVCVGYAQAYAIVARAIGLEAVVMSGNTLGVEHAWNRVNFSGDWVSTDPPLGITWELTTRT